MWKRLQATEQAKRRVAAPQAHTADDPPFEPVQVPEVAPGRARQLIHEDLMAQQSELMRSA